MFNFFAYISRMKYIARWSLMRNSFSENIQEHSHAVAVLAHPFLNLKTPEALREFLAQAKDCGLDGMETMYPLFDEETSRLAYRIAGEFGLQPSGGSDFHGRNKPDIRLGTGKGSLAVPMTCLDGLKATAFRNN